VNATAAATTSNERGLPDPIAWRDGEVRVLDQRALPAQERILPCRVPGDLVAAVTGLAIRGAPLLGVAGAYGVALAAERSRGDAAVALDEMAAARDLLVAARPTAVNLARGADRALAAGRDAKRRGVEAVRAAALDEAEALLAQERASCDAIGRLGAAQIPEGARVLTHCNTGRLATGGIGTALGAIVTAHRQGKGIHVWVDETRPLLQGARLTAWELGRLGVPMTLVADAAAGSLMARGLVDLVIVGADRIAASGDVANKIGTYPLAVLARHHGVPFLVAAPTTTVDLETPDGASIRLEDRDEREITRPFGSAVAPDGTRAENPAFDVTPGALISAIVTDRGVVRPPYEQELRTALRAPAGSGSRPREAAEA